MALAAAVGLWAWQRPEGRWLRTNVNQKSQTALLAGRRAAQVARREAEAAKWKLGFRPREAQPSVPVLAAAEPPRTPEVGQNITLEGGAPAPAVPAFQLTNTPLSDAPEPTTVTPVPGTATPGPAQEPGAVWSIANPDVVPPRLIRPQFARSPQPGTPVADLPEDELVVSAAGEVESVKLASPGRGTQPGMQLSAIKAWRYEPATRGGQPVRYRLRVRLPIQ